MDHPKFNSHKRSASNRVSKLLSGAGHAEEAGEFADGTHRALDASRKRMARGGMVADGEAPMARMDRPSRKGGTTININLSTGKKDDAAPVDPAASPAASPISGILSAALAQKAAQQAPQTPAGGMPMQGGPPQMPGMKRGGAVSMKFGAGGGKGRLEKAKLCD